ncbi:CoA transferase [Streptomyces nigrescens]|uniref:CoA transferase n=2 Tax=Streptomyces TaxID=1883 RepID=A0ABN6R108_STRNI|nr:CoA transferase [Streptomyces nigrescens]MEE4424185.1 CoA transferase [Streptomyces sp. DSM 41528]BDM71190.1 CoA transferase [Streptomyces nigrescens]
MGQRQGGGGGRGTASAWAALGGEPGLIERVAYRGPDGLLPARLPVGALARGTVAVCALAAAELAAARRGGPVPAVRVDEGAVATAFVSERHLRIDGRPMSTFAPLSRFWRAADGWVRTHANYPHHRARLLRALGLPDGAGVPEVAAELAGRAAEEIEETVYAAGGLAVAARTPGEWARHPQGAAAAAGPLLTLGPLGAGGPPRALPPLAGHPVRPAAGLRVLDLTRVIAGPVATRTLALLGADVLRIDAPQLPESQDAHSDTGFGKRSTALDLGSAAGRATFEDLLAHADVVVTGYRPGALDRFGLAPEELAARRPGLVVARLSAWGDDGPWGGRRGFDSLVQVATGIAVVEAGADGTLGALPAQALDHGTGYLLAAAVLRALTEQTRTGGSFLATLALARTAHWLMHGLAGGAGEDGPVNGFMSEPMGVPADAAAPGGRGYDPADHLRETGSPLGRLRHALPPVSFEGAPDTWATPPGRVATDAPVWR